VLSGQSEREELRRSKVGRAWQRMWGRMNLWVAKRAVPEDEPRTSPLYQWLVCAVTYVMMTPGLVAAVLIVVEGKDSNHAALAYKWWIACKVPSVRSYVQPETCHSHH
jgi:hypothetical protein